MKLALLITSLVASASAFAPSQRASPATMAALSAAADYKGEVGVTAPFGVFDPLNILDTADRERFDRLREVELKHGRVAMLGVVGYLTTYGM
jgi:Chlorophyll A-B binding protein